MYLFCILCIGVKLLLSDLCVISFLFWEFINLPFNQFTGTIILQRKQQHLFFTFTSINLAQLFLCIFYDLGDPSGLVDWCTTSEGGL